MGSGEYETGFVFYGRCDLQKRWIDVLTKCTSSERMEVDIRDQFGREQTQPMEVAVGGSFGGGVSTVADVTYAAELRRDPTGAVARRGCP